LAVQDFFGGKAGGASSCWVWVVEYPLDLMTGGSPESGDVISRCLGETALEDWVTGLLD